MPKIEIPFVGGAYTMPALQLDAQTCINWYLVFDQTGKSPKALFPTDGLSLFTSFPDQKNVRGQLELNNDLYVVAGNGFYVVDTSRNFVKRGTLKQATGPVKMVPNNNQIFITDGSNAYNYQYKKNATRPIHEFTELNKASSNIEEPTFKGAGLNDMSIAGTFTGTSILTYVVEIDKKANPDEFRWSDNGGSTWNVTNVPITGLNQTIGAWGVEIKFGHTTGHTLNDKWTFKATPDNTFYVPVIPAQQDGYGLYIRQNSDKFYISAIDDFTLVNALDSAEERVWPDYLQAAISIREELWLIGRTVCRVWYNTGNPDFPFQPRTNLSIKYGTIAPYSVAVGHDNVLFWLGNNDEGGAIALMIVNYQPKIISSEALNNEWLTYERVDDAIGFVVQKGGHVFYHLVFPTADRTWVYDMTVQSVNEAWHEKRSTYTNELPAESDKRQGRWLGNNHAYFAGKNLIGDWSNGNLYYLDNTNYTDYGIEVWRERAARTLDENLKRMFIDSLQVDVQSGQGLTDDTTQGYDPQIMLQVSKDDAMSWGNELWRSSGKIGKYGTRVKWNRLGASRAFTFRIRTSDPVYNVIMKAVAEVEVSDT